MEEKLEKSDNPLVRTLSIDMSLQDHEKLAKSRLIQIGKTARIKGFRPGKIPLSIIEKQHGSYVRKELIDDEIKKTFWDTVKKRGLRVAAPPAIEIIKATDETSLSYKATFEVYPEVGLPDFSGLDIKKFELKLGDEDIEKMVDRVRRQKVVFQSVTRKSKSGDQIKVDYAGSVNGEFFEGGSAEDALFVIGQSQLLPEFEKNLIDRVRGDNFKFEMIFPSDYQKTELQGKNSIFEITVKDVAEPIFPNIDEEFIKSLGVKSGSRNDMLEMVKSNLLVEGDRRAKAKTREQIFSKISDAIKLDLPNALVTQERLRIEHQAKSDMQSRGIKKNEISLPNEALEKEAKNRVRLGIIISEIARQRSLTVDSKELRVKVEEFSKNYENPQQVVQWHYEDLSRLERFESIMIEELVIEKVLEESKADVETVDFFTLTGESV